MGIYYNEEIVETFERNGKKLIINITIETQDRKL